MGNTYSMGSSTLVPHRVKAAEHKFTRQPTQLRDLGGAAAAVCLACRRSVVADALRLNLCTPQSVFSHLQGDVKPVSYRQASQQMNDPLA
jgi:hypothetical protein